MDIVKSWAVGIGVLFLGTIATFMVIIFAASSDQLDSTGGLLVWSGVPTVIVYGLGTFGAAAVHPRPARERTGRHVLAVVGPPVIMLLLSVPFSLDTVTAAGIATTVAGAVIGCAIGWVLGDLVRRSSATGRRPTGYWA